MFGSKLRELERRIERLEYREPKDLESFYRCNKYVKIDNLYWLDREWFINQLGQRNCYLYKDGCTWTLCLVWGNNKYKYARGFFVGEIYESYLSLKDSMLPECKQTKNKNAID